MLIGKLIVSWRESDYMVTYCQNWDTSTSTSAKKQHKTANEKRSHSNVFAKGGVADEQVIKSAYIDGFIDALMLGKDQIKLLQNNRPAIKQEAIMAAELYYNSLKK